jgi:glutamyl-tRNA reductase
MFSDVALIHRNGSTPFHWSADAAMRSIFLWQTCLRKMAFAEPDRVADLPLEPGDEVLDGLSAYQLCLEVACGLRSPLVGETEVLGQFKNAFQSFRPPETPFGTQLRRFAKSVFEDAKKVRQAHLDSLGSQSYGSVVRRELKGMRRVDVVGAGQLVGEMLPWLAKDGVELRVHARDPLKARAALTSISSQVQYSALDMSLGEAADLSGARALVIAAPIPAAQIGAWLKAGGASNVERLIDLRADSATDRLLGSEGGARAARLITLPEAMALVDSNQERIQARKRAALAHVSEMVEARARHVDNRPFGWEDVCA